MAAGMPFWAFVGLPISKDHFGPFLFFGESWEVYLESASMSCMTVKEGGTSLFGIPRW